MYSIPVPRKQQRALFTCAALTVILFVLLGSSGYWSPPRHLVSQISGYWSPPRHLVSQITTKTESKGEQKVDDRNNGFMRYRLASDNGCYNVTLADVGQRQWKQVIKNVFIYSAFIDRKWSSKDQPLIRIIAIKLRNDNPTLHCQLWYDDTHLQIEIVQAAYEDIPEGHGFRYSAAFIKCPLRRNTKPIAVSLVAGKCENASNVLTIEKEHDRDSFNENNSSMFRVCVSPLNRSYRRTEELIHMVEMNRIFGGNIFTFYNHSVASNVASILEQYQREGLVDLLQWDIPVSVEGSGRQPEIHYFGQMAMLNDCLSRYRYVNKYIAFVDLDEILVPRSHGTWLDLIHSISNHHQYSDFVFPNTFFPKEWSNITEEFPGKNIAKKYNILSLLKATRETKIYGHRLRSKLIVRPDLVKVMGIHQTWTGGKSYNVPSSLGLLHHYRRSYDPANRAPNVTDKYIHTFREKILERIISRWETVL